MAEACAASQSGREEAAKVVQLGTQLEQQELELVCKSIEHDLQLYHVWVTKTGDRKAAMYFAKLSWSKERSIKAKKVASDAFESTSPHYRLCMETLPAKPQEAMAKIWDTVQHVSKLHHIDLREVVCCLL